MTSDEAPGAEHDSEGSDAELLSRRFQEFADAFPDLRLYHAICAGAAQDPEVTALLTSASRGQARPVLLLAALHDLVLRRNDLDVARWYPSVTGTSMPDGDPWPEVRAACLEHSDELRSTIATHSTQTNEVGRAATLLPLLASAASDVAERPVALVELGCSAGLLLNLDRYRISIDADEQRHVLGDLDSPVRLTTTASGMPSPTLDLPVVPSILQRVGIDAAPVSVRDHDHVRWLEACLWPDQPERIERFRAAVEVARRHPVTVVAGDMVDDLESVAHSARAVAAASASMSRLDAPDVHLVVVCSWALTYVERSRRPLIADALAALAADGRAVTWLSAEPPGAVPEIPLPSDTDDDSGTVLGIRRWRDGRELAAQAWANAHPHGAWFDRSVAQT